MRPICSAGAHRFLATAALVMSIGCTAVSVQPVDPQLQIGRVCIEKNPAVEVVDFLDVVRAGFRRHGIETNVYDGTPPRECEFVLRYTARRSWDLASYMAHAELHLERSGQPLASAIYHLRGGGGYALTKYDSTRKKMNPVIDELLAGRGGQAP